MFALFENTIANLHGIVSKDSAREARKSFQQCLVQWQDFDGGAEISSILEQILESVDALLDSGLQEHLFDLQRSNMDLEYRVQLRERELQTNAEILKSIQGSYEKAQQDLNRLKSHLLEVQHAYSSDCSERDRRIEDLERRLAQFNYRLDSTEFADESLDELNRLRTELDVKTKDCELAKTSAANLQSVLEQVRIGQLLPEISVVLSYSNQ